MLGFAILMAFNLLGIILQKLLGIPLPGNVIGMILFTCCLAMKWIRLEWVEQTASFLIKHLMLFFAPVIVGVLAFAHMLQEEWLVITVSLLLSTVVVMLVTGGVTQVLSKAEKEQVPGE